MLLFDALQEFELSKDHSPSSKQWYLSRLSSFIAWMTEQDVTTIEAVSAPLVRRYIDFRRTAPSKTGKPLDSHTLHGHVRAIRAFLNWAIGDDLINEKVVKRIALPVREQKILPVLSKPQIDRLFAACDTSETPEYVARNRAILAVLLDSGLRANELCSLETSDAHLSDDDAYLIVRTGKGRRQREVPLGKKARLLLAKYIHRHRPRGGAALFVAKGGSPLTVSGLEQLIGRLIQAAGEAYFAGLKQGAHLFRHTFAVTALEAGMDIYRLSRIMGHSTVSTTEGYLKSFTARQARTGSISPLDVATRRGR